MLIEITGKFQIVFLDGIPAFSMYANGIKEPVTPNGWVIYENNKKEVDEYINELTDRLINHRSLV